MFLVVGPNTGLGHTSLIVMIEAQVHYIIETIRVMRKNNWNSVDVKKEAQEKYNVEIQNKMQNTVWQTGGCNSWYKNKNGKNVTLWPDYTFKFRRRTLHFDPKLYHLAS